MHTWTIISMVAVFVSGKNIYKNMDGSIIRNNAFNFKIERNKGLKCIT